MEQTNTLTAGIDTSKVKLDVAVDGQGKAWRVGNAEPGWRNLVEELARRGVKRVGIEASGGYERGVVKYLRAAGFTVLVLQPLQVKAYAQMVLQRAKNDAIDAALIAACAARLPDPRLPPDPRLEDLAGELTFLEQTEEDIARYKTRLEHADERQREIVMAQIKASEQLRTAQLRRIIDALKQHPDLAKRFALIESVRGIGERTAVAIIVRMPEIGRLSREEIAALAGLAPFDNESGRWVGKRQIAGGRSRLRRSLYAAALPASRWNRALVELYKRLREAGKPHKLALVACARKLLIFANTVVQRGTPWTDKPMTKQAASAA
jgi:transposase